jgi:hypothetical protein
MEESGQDFGSLQDTETDDDDYAHEEGIRKTGRKAPLTEGSVLMTAIGRATQSIRDTGMPPRQPFLKPTQLDIDYISVYVNRHANYGTYIRYPPEPYRSYYLACQKQVLTVKLSEHQELQ